MFVGLASPIIAEGPEERVGILRDIHRVSGWMGGWVLGRRRREGLVRREDVVVETVSDYL